MLAQLLVYKRKVLLRRCSIGSPFYLPLPHLGAIQFLPQRQWSNPFSLHKGSWANISRQSRDFPGSNQDIDQATRIRVLITLNTLVFLITIPNYDPSCALVTRSLPAVKKRNQSKQWNQSGWELFSQPIWELSVDSLSPMTRAAVSALVEPTESHQGSTATSR